MNSTFTWFNRLASLVLATVLVLGLMVAPAQAKSLAVDEILDAAGKDYLAEVLKDYGKASQDALASTLKDAQKLVNTLAEDLEEAADPTIEAAKRAAILNDVNAAKASLADLANSFRGLATDTESFDSALQTAVENLLGLVKGDVNPQLSQTKTTLEQIAEAVADLSNSAATISADDLTSGLKNFGRSITALNQALAQGSQAIQVTSALFTR